MYCSNISQVKSYIKLFICTSSVETRRNKSTEKGVIIRDVVPNSPADNAGLKSGDEIIKVDEHSLVGVPHEKV